MNYFQCSISSIGRVGYISLDVSHFYKVYSICKVLFAYSNRISLEELDQGYNIDVVEEWLPDEDLLTLTIEPIVVGQFVPEEVVEAVDLPRWNIGEPNIGFPIVPVLIEDVVIENVARIVG